jgi:dTDP-4-amino-4,6-dideoxy-D-galactose acyltransferase
MNERCEFLEWDSEFFGLQIARLHGFQLRPEEIAAIDRWCVAERIDCLYFLADCGCPETIATVERNGFGCKDVRVTYEWKSALRARGVRPRIGGDVTVRERQGSDIEALAAIARSVHTATRFFFDSRFDPNRAAVLYETWIRQACERDHVFVGVAQGDPAGYLTCQITEAGAGCIGLSAVATRYHGQGIGRAMMEAALEWFAGRGISDIRVVTQGRNVAAHRFYQSAGFLTRSVESWFHKWYT